MGIFDSIVENTMKYSFNTFLWITLLLIVLTANACHVRPSETEGADGRFSTVGGGSIESQTGDNAGDSFIESPADEIEDMSAISTSSFENDGQTEVADSGAVLDPISVYTEAWLSVMTTEQKIGQLFVVRLPDKATEVNDSVKYLTEAYQIGGYILFNENINSKDQVRKLTAELSALSEIPMFVAIDEEGGRVSRVGKLYDTPVESAYQTGLTGDSDAAYHRGLILGERLAELGINLDFAPVADIWSNEANTVIGDRAFSQDAETAAIMTEAAVRGFKEAGILTVVKHFPGHGDTVEDTHQEIALYPYERERFDRFESLPFKKGIEAGADGVMVGHIATPLLHNSEAVYDWMEPWREQGRLPATFSDYWMHDVLRGEMGFDGLIFTDALEMKALTASFTNAQIAVGAFLAGADILLMPADPAIAIEAMREAYQSGQITDERLDLSVRRILRAKATIR